MTANVKRPRRTTLVNTSVFCVSCFTLLPVSSTVRDWTARGPMWCLSNRLIRNGFSHHRITKLAKLSYIQWIVIRKLHCFADVGINISGGSYGKIYWTWNFDHPDERCAWLGCHRWSIAFRESSVNGEAIFFGDVLTRQRNEWIKLKCQEVYVWWK